MKDGRRTNIIKLNKQTHLDVAATLAPDQSKPLILMEVLHLLQQQGLGKMSDKTESECINLTSYEYKNSREQKQNEGKV